jgi:hypothetical protein
VTNPASNNTALIAGLSTLTCVLCGGASCLVVAVAVIGVILLRQSRH